MAMAYVIFPGSGQWTLARVQREQCQLAKTEPNAPAVAAALRDLGYRDEGILLALPSQLCLCASVEEAGLRGRGGRASGLLFRLEEQLPIALEELVADFIPCNGRSLGIAVTTSSVRPMIDSLEAQGIVIAGICPAALLLSDQVCQGSQWAETGAILCRIDGRIDLLLVEDRQVVQWMHLGDCPELVLPHLRQAMLSRGNPLPLMGVDLPAALNQSLSDQSGIQILPSDSRNALELSALAVGRILASGISPPVQLRCGGLAAGDPLRQVRIPLRAVLAASVLLLLSLAGSMLLKASQYNHLAEQAQARQARAFHAALPNQSLPPSIISRLQSEQKKLAGLSGAASSVPPSQSVLPLLRDTLGGLPHDLRFRLLELRFEPQRLYIEGQTLDHSGADAIAAALRKSTSLSVDPPHTQQAAGEDVSFTLTAAVASSTDVANFQGGP